MKIIEQSKISWKKNDELMHVVNLGEKINFSIKIQNLDDGLMYVIIFDKKWKNSKNNWLMCVSNFDEKIFFYKVKFFRNFQKMYEKVKISEKIRRTYVCRNFWWNHLDVHTTSRVYGDVQTKTKNVLSGTLHALDKNITHKVTSRYVSSPVDHLEWFTERTSNKQVIWKWENCRRL